jgi:hypothetical protein
VWKIKCVHREENYLAEKKVNYADTNMSKIIWCIDTNEYWLNANIEQVNKSQHENPYQCVHFESKYMNQSWIV